MVYTEKNSNNGTFFFEIALNLDNRFLYKPVKATAYQFMVEIFVKGLFKPYFSEDLEVKEV